MAIQLIKGEADMLFAIRRLRGQWVDAKSLSLMLYPDKRHEVYYFRARTRLAALAALGLVQMRPGKPGKYPATYTVTDAGTFDPVEITVNQHTKTSAANAFRSQSMAAYHERKRMEKEAEGETADDRWAALPPVRVIVDAKQAPRVPAEALRAASVFAWAAR